MSTREDTARIPSGVDVTPQEDVLVACASGEVIPLSEVADPVFNGGLLGKGCGIRPVDGMLYSPADGTVTCTTGTNHAIGITTDDGIEVLMHIGIDTVEMRGDGFTLLTEKDARVDAGQPLISFDRDKIGAAGHDDVVIMVVSNTAAFSDVTVDRDGTISAGQALLGIVRS